MTDPTPAEALKADWHCPICLCRSHARIDQQIADGTFAPGPRIRCVDCKRDWLLPIPLSPPDAGEVRTYRDGVASGEDETELRARGVLGQALRDIGEHRMAENFAQGQHPIVITSQAALLAIAALAKAYRREGVEDAAKVCAEWSTMLNIRVDDLIRIRAPQRTVKAIREAANQVLNVEAAIRKLP